MRHYGACAIILSLAVFASPTFAITPDDPGPGDVAFTIDAGTSQPISPLIYGVNGSLRPTGVTGLRLGGNRWTGYNWETNNSNAGSDYFHVNDQFLTGAYGQTTSPGEAVLPTLQETASLGATTNVTVPMAGYVSADQNGTVTPAQTAPSSRWNEIRSRKETVYPGSSLSLAPNLNDNYVFTDEFVNWVESNRQNGQQVNYLLDNEPALWTETHPYLYGPTKATFADVGQKSIETAAVIKDLNPNAKVLGGVTFGWSAMQTLQDAPDFDQQVPPAGRDLKDLHFNRWLLETMAAEEQQQGRVLMDALDVHWYPEARGGGVRITAEGAFNNSPAVVEARLQAPRSLWDPTYIEDSWITDGILRDYSGQGNHEGVELLNRVQDDIAEFKPGTLLSVSEYNYGGGNHISGGIAQADVLGIFGREGVWNASWWPIEDEANSQYVKAGFEMYTDFDGQGGRFGDLSVSADTDSVAESSVYASRSTENPNEMIVVAINRTSTPLDAAIQITDDQQYTSAEVFQLTDAAATPTFSGEFPIDLVNALLYEMPAYSVSTIRLIADTPGDFDGNGTVDAADLAEWTNEYSTTLNGNDFLTWQRAVSDSPAIASSLVPEPGSWSLLILCMPFASSCFRSVKR